nr:T-complex protein 11 [Tanacetum cinerariifolium]
MLDSADSFEVGSSIGMTSAVHNIALSHMLQTQPSHILGTVIDAELVAVSNDSTKTQSRRLVMARMLRKSVQAGHPIFVKVSRAVYLATRGVVLGGSGTKGRELAEKLALRQVGAAVLTDKLVNFTEELGVIARVSKNVHGLWYARLIENM